MHLFPKDWDGRQPCTFLCLLRQQDRCGYELFQREGLVPGSEMEALMLWLTDPNTRLAREHPEFGMLRDMVFLYKFLATMESREGELLRKRKDIGQFYTWRLSFEEVRLVLVLVLVFLCVGLCVCMCAQWSGVWWC